MAGPDNTDWQAENFVEICEFPLRKLRLHVTPLTVIHHPPNWNIALWISRL